VSDRDAEDADDGVADELLDGAAVRLHDLAGGGVIDAQDGVDIFGIGSLAHRREGDEVAEESRDDLAFFRDWRRCGQRGSALITELGVVRILRATGGAGDHLGRLSGCATPATRLRIRPSLGTAIAILLRFVDGP
jgi:hypothetical protein